MSSGLTEQSIALLRRQFDESFQVKVENVGITLANYLLLRVGELRYAASMREVRLLQSRCHITDLPSADERLLGLTTARGQLIAVYDLAASLGHARSVRAPWMMIVQGTSLAFAFDALERHVAAATESVSGASAFVTAEIEERKVAVPLLNLRELAKCVSTGARLTSKP